MFLPYKRYKCVSCDKWHRMGFRQWWKTVKEMSDYQVTQWNASDYKTSESRLDEKFNLQRKPNWLSRWLKKFIK